MPRPTSCSARVILYLMLAACHAATDDLARTLWGNHSRGRVHKKNPFPRNGGFSWQAPMVQHLASKCQRGGCETRDLYEFGVYTGRYMRGVALALNRSGVPFRTFWGFDSFEGLPEESSATVRSNISSREWQRGSFSVAEVLEDWSYASLEQRVRRYLVSAHMARDPSCTAADPRNARGPP